MSQHTESPTMIPMRVEQLPAIMKIEKASFGRFSWSQKGFRKCIDSETAFVLCDQDSAVVGYALLKKHDAAVSIEKMAVDPDRRKQGLGTFILKWVFEESMKNGAERLVLHVRGSNTAAFKLYARNGFSETARENAGYRQHNPQGLERIKITMVRPLARTS